MSVEPHSQCKEFLVPMTAGYTERLERCKGYRNVLDNFVSRSMPQRCNYEGHFMLDGASLHYGLPVRLWLDKNSRSVDGCRGPSEIGSDRTLCSSSCWGWPNGKRIDSN